MNECPDCQGKGFVIEKVPHKVYYDAGPYDDFYIDGWDLERKTCTHCNGTGIIRHICVKKKYAQVLSDECLSLNGGKSKEN